MRARRNENGEHQPDGRYYLGKGSTAGYAIFNAGASYTPSPKLELMVQVNNLFDKRYATSAQLGPAGFDGSGNFQARPFPAVGGEFGVQHSTFYAPGAPRLFWLGVRYLFDKPGA
ncbi:TonB-dependent receptor [Noviherbaspirillum saxi]|uniref:TonB-dependent receptor n=1 Tax=Noviherbaspirillum saxi TaxID=2320863 RepID=UPI001F412AF4|nr:TonB-dependent receptor [Noviherbaspirillum saxi]